MCIVFGYKMKLLCSTNEFTLDLKQNISEQEDCVISSDNVPEILSLVLCYQYEDEMNYKKNDVQYLYPKELFCSWNYNIPGWIGQTKVADAMALGAARSSATMVLNMQHKLIHVSHKLEKFQLPAPSQYWEMMKYTFKVLRAWSLKPPGPDSLMGPLWDFTWRTNMPSSTMLNWRICKLWNSYGDTFTSSLPHLPGPMKVSHLGLEHLSSELRLLLHHHLLLLHHGSIRLLHPSKLLLHHWLPSSMHPPKLLRHHGVALSTSHAKVPWKKW